METVAPGQSVHEKYRYSEVDAGQYLIEQYSNTRNIIVSRYIATFIQT